MGWWQINADTLAGSRFVLSPLAETFACLKLLHAATAAHPGRAGVAGRPICPPTGRGWPPTRSPRCSCGPGSGRRWIADFLTAAPRGGETFEEEVDAGAASAARGRPRPSAGRLGGPLPAAPATATICRSAPPPCSPRVEGGRAPVLGAAPADPRGRRRRPDGAGWARAAGRRRWTRCGRGRAGWAATGCRSTCTSYPPREISGAAAAVRPGHAAAGAGCPGRGRGGTRSSTRARGRWPTTGPAARAGGAGRAARAGAGRGPGPARLAR